MADAYVKTFEVNEEVEVTGSFTPTFDVRGDDDTDMLLSVNLYNPEFLVNHDPELYPQIEMTAFDALGQQSSTGYRNGLRIYIQANSYPYSGTVHFSFSAVFTPVTQEA